MKKIISFCISFALFALTACQQTPEESAIVSKAEGLSSDVITTPLGDGEIIAVDVPEHWTMIQKKSNDRVTISADLEMGKIEVGNLPVIEMCNHIISQEELNELVSYFTDGEDLYKIQPYTKAEY